MQNPFPPLDQPTTYVGPTPESNWVIPGVLLVGAFPAEIDDTITFFQLSEILKSRINKFVCLQNEYRIDAQEEMWRSGEALRPYFKDVVNIVENKDKFETFNNSAVCDSAELSFVHFPIQDCGVANDTEVLFLCQQLVQSIYEGNRLYIHCWGGHGRTGTVVCIMLCIMYEISAEEAMERCQIVHDMREHYVDVGSPQTQIQRDQVTRIVSMIRKPVEFTDVSAYLNFKPDEIDALCEAVDDI